MSAADPLYEIGVPLDLYSEDLPKVMEEHDLNPVGSFDPFLAAGPGVREYVDAHYDESFGFMDVAHDLPLAIHERLGFAERLMVRFSTDSCYGSDKVRDLLENDPRHEIVYKIGNSMWKWGYGKAGWNETVDVYDGIRSFDLGVPGFGVLLDRTCHFHSRGPSKYAGVFLDGSFGFHVIHAGRRVMTIGFSVTAGRRILINQIQTACRKGNRWMFRFPSDRVATVVEAFGRAFPTHTIHLVDGEDAVRKIMKEYEEGVTRRETRIAEWRDDIARGSTFRTQHHVDVVQKEIEEIRHKISHLRGDAPRISEFYRASEAFRLGAKLTANGLKHREVLPLAA